MSIRPVVLTQFIDMADHSTVSNVCGLLGRRARNNVERLAEFLVLQVTSLGVLLAILSTRHADRAASRLSKPYEMISANQ